MVHYRAIMYTVNRLHVTHDRGFTLLELLVVVVIIGILASYAISTYSKHADNRHLANAITEIMSVFRRARVEAISRDGGVLVRLDAVDNRITVALDANGNNSYDAGIDTSLMTASISNRVEIKRVTSGDAITVTYFTGRHPAGDLTTVHIGLITSTYDSAHRYDWRSITINTMTGLLEYYPCGRNGIMPSTDCS